MASKKKSHANKSNRNAAHWKSVMAILLAVAVSSCSGLGVAKDMSGQDRLADCPDRPNCVSSNAKNPRHTVAPMVLIGDTATGWAAVQAVITGLPRSAVVKATDQYLHVALKSRLFQFVDDLELKLDPQSDVISIRSASRVGYFDLGVNRRRVESLRKQLKAKGLIE
jgi:uncharacterized protein (DUF1499 family)